MKITAWLQKLSYFKTSFKKLGKLIAPLAELPPIVRFGALVAVLAVLAVYVWAQTKSVVDVALLFGIVALVSIALWLITRAVRARGERLSAGFDQELRGTEMLEDLREQWSRATSELQSAGVDRYNMGFFMLIGEPQSGKTTTLQKSGLNFPIGMDKIQGIGGTRNLDWWFTDEAVILDTAGRLTFQEEQTTDGEEWQEFLRLLARYRPKAPVNGVIVTIPCTSLQNDDAETRERKAGVIRKALVEIERGLGIQFPVWVLLTKADRVAGFSEFFGRLRALEQSQLFGWARPRAKLEEPFRAEEVRGAFRGLVRRLRRWRVFLLDQYADEMEPAERDRMVPFPEEFASLEAPLAGYLEQIFPESKLLDPLFFRGFFMTSGVQKGEPVRRAAARILGGTRGADETIQRMSARTERAYFIRDFYRRKVFAERGLIVPTAARVRKVQLVKRVGYSAATAAAVLGLIWVGYRWTEMRSEVIEPVERIDAVRDAYVASEDGGGRPFEVLAALEGLGEIPDTGRSKARLREVDFVEAGVGVLPEIIRGDLLGTRSFFKVGESQQDGLKSGLVRTLRVGLVDGVMAPLASAAVDTLRNLNQGTDVTTDLAASLRLRREGAATLAAMLVEEHRAADEEAPKNVDAFFELAARGARGDDLTESDLIARGGHVYRMLRDSYTKDVDEGLGGPAAVWGGLGLPAALVTQEKRLRKLLPETIENVRNDTIRALEARGTGDLGARRLAGVAYPERVRDAERAGQYVDEESLAERVAGTDHERAALIGYLYLRAASLAESVNEGVASMAAIEARIGGAPDRRACESVVGETAARWTQLEASAQAGLRELESIGRVLDQGVTVSFDDAVLAALAPTNEFFAALTDMLEGRDGAAWASLTEDERARLERASEGDTLEANRWIGLDEKVLRSAHRTLAGHAPRSSRASEGLERWVVLIEMVSDETAGTTRLESKAAIDRLRTQLADTRGLFVNAPSGDVSLETRVQDLTTAVATEDGRVRSARLALARLALARDVDALTERLTAGDFSLADDIATDYVSSADVPAPTARDVEDKYALTQPVYWRTTLEDLIVKWIAPRSDEIGAVAASADVGAWADTTAATRALDAAASQFLVEWSSYWATEQPAEFVAAIELIANDHAKDWTGVKRSVHGMFGGARGSEWARRLGHYRERIDERMRKGAGHDKATLLEGVARLPRARAALDALFNGQEVSSQSRARLSDEVLENFAAIFSEPDYDFEEHGRGRWRRALVDEEARDALDDAFAPLLEELEGGSGPYGAIDRSVRTLARAAHGAIAAELLESMGDDYTEMRSSSAMARFPFARFHSGNESEEAGGRAIGDLRALLGPRGAVRNFIATYRPLGVLPYVLPGDRVGSDVDTLPDEAEPGLFAEGAEAPADIVFALSTLEDLCGLFAPNDIEGQPAPLVVLARLDESTSDPEIFNGIVRLNVATRRGSLAGAPSEKLAHLYPGDAEEQRLEMPSNAQAFALQFSNGIDADERFEFVIARIDEAGDERTAKVLRSQRSLALLAVLEEAMRGSGLSELEVDWTGGVADEPRRSVVTVPLRVRYEAQAGEPPRSGTVGLQIAVEEHFVPALPIVLPSWE